LLTAKSKFVRQQALQDEFKTTTGKIHCFKFTELSNEHLQILRKFLAESK
jgi:hypothetical protein